MWLLPPSPFNPRTKKHVSHPRISALHGPSWMSGKKCVFSLKTKAKKECHVIFISKAHKDLEGNLGSWFFWRFFVRWLGQQKQKQLCWSAMSWTRLVQFWEDVQEYWRYAFNFESTLYRHRYVLVIFCFNTIHVYYIYIYIYIFMLLLIYIYI